MQELNFQPLAPGEPRPFWEHPAFLAFLVVASAAPLLWPDIAPLVDLPGHMGRYRVQLDLAASPALQQYYSYDWALIGNLGVDLLVELLAPIIGLEPAVRLIVLTIPALTAAGLIWAAFEVHGRVPPTVLFALPFAYNYPFLFGFVNFALAMALALNAFALWLRLGRLHQVRLRAVLFVPISIILWVVHAFGWGTLGVLAFSAELVRQHDRGRGYVVGSVHAAKHCLSLALPLLMMVYWRSNAGGQTGDWFNWRGKAMWLFMVLRDRWAWFDLASLAIAAGVLVAARGSRHLRYSRNLAASALFLLLVFCLLPRVVFGSAYADMRLAPYIFAIALIAIRFPLASRRTMLMFGVAGAMFFVTRTAATSASMVIYDRTYDSNLAAIEHIPHGARLVSFVGRPCIEPWAMSRLLHLPAMATVRREAFSNDQWVLPGAQLLTVRYQPGAGFFTQDASQIVTEVRCRYEPWRTIDQALAHFPRESFDYVWLIDPPRHDPQLLRGLVPIWRDGTSVLYRVADRTPVVPPPSPFTSP